MLIFPDVTRNQPRTRSVDRFIATIDGKGFAMADLKNKRGPNNIDLGKGLKFCLNCDDMDDLAVDSENNDRELIEQRFQNCKKTGRFDGDVCSRMYVVNEDDLMDEQFTDPDEESDT